MDALILFEKIAGLNDGSLGFYVAQDVMSAVNTKLAALTDKEAAIRVPSLSNIVNIAKGATPDQMRIFSERLRSLGMGDKLKQMSGASSTLSKATAMAAPKMPSPPKVVPPTSTTTGGYGATGGYSSGGFDPTGGYTNRRKNLSDYLAKK
jgi:hypothetical protein